MASDAADMQIQPGQGRPIRADLSQVDIGGRAAGRGARSRFEAAEAAVQPRRLRSGVDAAQVEKPGEAKGLGVRGTTCKEDDEEGRSHSRSRQLYGGGQAISPVLTGLTGRIACPPQAGLPVLHRLESCTMSARMTQYIIRRV